MISPHNRLRKASEAVRKTLENMSEAELSHEEDRLRLELDLVRHVRRMNRTSRRINDLNGADDTGPDDEDMEQEAILEN